MIQSSSTLPRPSLGGRRPKAKPGHEAFAGESLVAALVGGSEYKDRSPRPPSSDVSPAHLSAKAPVRERKFRLESDRDYASRSMMQHKINGRIFEMERINERVPFGETEIWTFVNDARFSHPFHVHATHFRVISRTGGSGARCWPWSGSQRARRGCPPVVRPGPTPWKPCGPNEENPARLDSRLAAIS